MRQAFSMIELVFVIVIIAILAGVVLPKISIGRDDAFITKTKADIAALRAGISTKYSQSVLSANPSYPQSLESTDTLFSAVLPVGFVNANGGEGWSKSGDNYTFRYKSGVANFTYNKADGSFVCTSGGLCNILK